MTVKNLYDILIEQADQIQFASDYMVEKSSLIKKTVQESEQMTKLIMEYEEILVRIFVNERKEIQFYPKHAWLNPTKFLRDSV